MCSHRGRVSFFKSFLFFSGLYHTAFIYMYKILENYTHNFFPTLQYIFLCTDIRFGEK